MNRECHGNAENCFPWIREKNDRIWRTLIIPNRSDFLFAKIEAAKEDRSWNALDASEALEIPPDLAKAFSENRIAKGYFDDFPRSVKKAILEWINSAKKPETRAKRVDETVTQAEKNIRANQWRGVSKT